MRRAVVFQICSACVRWVHRVVLHLRYRQDRFCQVYRLYISLHRSRSPSPDQTEKNTYPANAATTLVNEGCGSGDTELGSLHIPTEWHTGVGHQLAGGKVSRLVAIEDGPRDIGRKEARAILVNRDSFLGFRFYRGCDSIFALNGEEKACSG